MKPIKKIMPQHEFEARQKLNRPVVPVPTAKLGVIVYDNGDVEVKNFPKDLSLFLKCMQKTMDHVIRQFIMAARSDGEKYGLKEYSVLKSQLDQALKQKLGESK